MSKLLDRISRSDIEKAYILSTNNIKKNVINRFGLTSKLVDIYDDISTAIGNHVVYKIDILNSNGDSVLEFAFIRHLFPEKELWSGFCLYGKFVTGRVAYNVSLTVKSEYRKKGLAKVIYELENILYRKWGANEIQMTAAKQGKITWRKFGFLIHCHDIGLIEYLYEEWCRENGINYVMLMDTAQYPEKFLLSNKIKNFRMYKELA